MTRLARWNRASLLKACEQLLGRADLQIRLKPVQEPDTAGFTADYRNGEIQNILITVDLAQGGLIESVLHELLHIVLDREVNQRFNLPLEEAMIKALEKQLFTKAIKKGALARWRRLIRAKLA